MNRSKSKGHEVWRMEVAKWQMTWQRSGRPTETLGKGSIKEKENP